MATGRERPKVTRHTRLWMGSNNLRLLCRNRSLTQVKIVIKRNVSLLCGSISDDYCKARSYFWIWRKDMVQIWGSYFPQLVGVKWICLCEGSSSGFNESDCTYPLLFNFVTESLFLCVWKHIRLYNYILFIFSGCDLLSDKYMGSTLGHNICQLWQTEKHSE